MTPSSEAELAEVVAEASGPLRIVGGGTRPVGKPVAGEALETTGLSGITLYEPGALTLVAQAGTPVAEIEAALDSENQRLAFEPMDHRHLMGTTGTPTIGGVVAGNVAGSRRISVGACRDHMLGVRFVDGSGTIIKNGGRVMKNVTGYDLVKLLTGSYGTLGVLSEVSLKVLPKPETSATLVLHDLTPRQSVAAMSKALGSPYEVTGAAQHLTPASDAGICEFGQQTCIRIEGFEASVDYRFGKLKDLLATYGEMTRVDDTDSTVLWRDITNVRSFADYEAVERVSIRPSAAPEFAESLWQTLGADLAMDWGGGLMWFGLRDRDVATAAKQHTGPDPFTSDDGYATVHAVLQAMAENEGGHATFVKGPMAVRAAVPVFQPENATVTALSAGLRAKFDPRGVLNPGIMG